MASPLRIGILGSCVSRDMAHLHPECTVVTYVARQSLISAVSPPTEAPDLALSSAFQRRMVAGDLASTGLDALEANTPDLDALVIDLIDERLGVVPLTGGAFATDSQELKESGAKDLLHTAAPDLELGTAEHFRRWTEAVREVLSRLDRIDLLERTVVLSVPFASRTRDGRAVPPFMGRSAADWDAAYEPYYAELRELGLRVLRLPDTLALGDAEHRWGLSPYHFVPEAYAWMMNRVRSVLALDEGAAMGGSSQLVRMPLSLPVAGIRNPATAGTVRFPLHLSAPVDRWRLRITTLDQRSDRMPPGRVEITGLWLGREGAHGTFAGPPARRLSRRRLPGGWSGLVTPWFDDPIGHGEWLLSLGWSSEAGKPTVMSLADSYRCSDPDAAGRSDGERFLVSRYVPLSWAIEAEVPHSVPVVVAWGDDRALSSTPAAGLSDSALSRWARAFGALPVHALFPGTGLALWDEYQRQWRHTSLEAPASEVFHLMGSRDVAAGASLERLKELFVGSLARLEKNYGPNMRVVLLEAPPALDSGPSRVLSAYNEWLLATFPGAVYTIEHGSFALVREPLPAGRETNSTPSRGLPS